ncbi:ATP-binding protein [Flammeovirga sp. EKP202]|uniref:hybrid sensor histidine kinase/response regulator transcription factor n=1 Tax=Flammeovirga sp. EKP202 TaxID=2770592 RepID=UPI00165FDFEF|nr:ATP-binding protein [Flammeovirga sp. EKP202]MBD0404337.1 response regulator [Flammeovirga sp. EKP202]
MAIQYKLLTVNDGLSINEVTDILQDSHRQYLWISSQNGLNRYDGHEIKRIYLPKSLADNYISDIEEDEQKTIWLATNNGLARYNYITSTWEPIPIALHNGTYHMVRYIGNNSLLTLKGKNTIVKIDIGPSSEIKTTQKKAPFTIHAIEKVEQHTFVSTSQGLYTVDSNLEFKLLTKKFKGCQEIRYLKEQKEVWVNANGVWFNIPLSKGQLQIAQAKSSFQIFKTSKKIVQVYYAYSRYHLVYREGYESFTIKNGHAITSGFELEKLHFRNFTFDNKNNIWGTTWQSGVVMIPSNQPHFKSYHKSENVEALPSRLVRTFCSVNDSLLIIGTEEKGVVLFDTKHEKFYSPSTIPTADQIGTFDVKGKILHRLMKDWKGNIWCGYHEDGFNVVYGKDKEKINAAINAVIGPNEELIGDDFIPQPDRNRVLIFMRYSVYSYNYDDNTLRKLTQKFHYLNCAVPDHQGRIWIGRHYGLEVYDKELNHEDHTVTSIFKNHRLNVNCFFEDRKKNMWIGTYGNGLFCYFSSVNQMELIEAPTYLNLQIVYSITEDQNGILWLGSNNGLFSYDPHQKQFKRYGISEGIQGNQFNYRAVYQHQENDIYFGGIDGFTRFNPQDIPKSEILPAPIISDVNVGGDPFFPIQKNDFFEIPYHKNSFDVHFFCPDLTTSTTYTYSYKLHGFDKDFQYCIPNQPKVHFSNMQAGVYQLEIKVKKPNTVWSESTFSRSIIILPPWYRSNTAYVFYVFLVLIFFIGSIYITKRQALIQNSLRIAQIEKEKTEQLSQAKLHFFSDIAHEIRSPLTLIIAPLQEVLSYRTFDRPLQKSLEVMYRNASKLKNLMDELLLFRKAENEKITLQLSEYNFSSLLHHVTMLYQSELDSKKIQLRYFPSEEKYVFDYSKLEIVISNLVHNAIKYTPNEGQILIETNTEFNGLAFKVSDNGMGMKAENLDHIFQHFYQEQNTGKEGFGIGLSLCKKIIESHSGSIDVESEVNKGTTFTVKIPKLEVTSGIDVQLPKLMELTKEDTSAVKTTIKGHLLIVEDNEEIQQYILHIFEQQYKVSLAKDGEEGFEIAKNSLPDVIITDFMMPKMNGVALCKSIKEEVKTSHIPVIILSAFSEIEDQINGLQVGANDYIGKPFDQSVLLQKIENWIDFKTKTIASFKISSTLEAIQLEKTDQLFLERLNRVIQRRIADDQLDVIALCTALGMGKTTLSEKLRSMLDTSPAEYIKKIRLKEAYRLLTQEQYTVSEAAFAVGFNPSYFSTAFKKQYGVSPKGMLKQ